MRKIAKIAVIAKIEGKTDNHKGRGGTLTKSENQSQELRANSQGPYCL